MSWERDFRGRIDTFDCIEEEPMDDDTRTKLKDILTALSNDDIGTARQALWTLLGYDSDEPAA